jgi:hypothetical protein
MERMRWAGWGLVVVLGVACSGSGSSRRQDGGSGQDASQGPGACEQLGGTCAISGCFEEGLVELASSEAETDCNSGCPPGAPCAHFSCCGPPSSGTDGGGVDQLGVDRAPIGAVCAQFGGTCNITQCSPGEQPVTDFSAIQDCNSGCPPGAPCAQVQCCAPVTDGGIGGDGTD